jgi:hypothetical protein
MPQPEFFCSFCKITCLFYARGACMVDKVVLWLELEFLWFHRGGMTSCSLIVDCLPRAFVLLSLVGFKNSLCN